MSLIYNYRFTSLILIAFFSLLLFFSFNIAVADTIYCAGEDVCNAESGAGGDPPYCSQSFVAPYACNCPNVYASCDVEQTFSCGYSNNPYGTIQCNRAETCNCNFVYGCTNPVASNYNPNANTDNGTCILPRCGDGNVDTSYGETCDAGTANNGGCPKLCGSDCQTNDCPPPSGGAVCGNNTVESGEACDTGVDNGSCPRTCSNSCTVNNCGGSGNAVVTFTASGPGTAVSEWGTCRNATCQLPLPSGTYVRIWAEHDYKANGPYSWVTVCPAEGSGNLCQGTLTTNVSAGVTFTNPITVPVTNNVSVNCPINPNGTNQYEIQVISTDSGGGQKIREQYTMAYDGAGGSQERGFITWGISNFWPSEKDARACTDLNNNGLGGYAAIQSTGDPNSTYGHEFVELDSCSTSVSGSSRISTFVVRYNTNFVSPSNNLDLGAITVNTDLNNSGWIWLDLNCPVLVPPTNVTLSCPSPGNTATASWTAPPGWWSFFTRVGDSAGNPLTSNPGWNDDYSGTSISFPTTPGQSYRFWVHTRNDATGQYSLGVYATPNPVTCPVAPTPDLTAGTPTPTTATAGTALTFTTTITNSGTASTGVSFNNRFQVATASNGGGTISTLSVNSRAALSNGSSGTVTSSSYTFPSGGTYSVRTCADSDASGVGTITESNEGNNCGAWQNVMVSANLAPTVTSPTATSITSTGATLGANVTSLGSPASISARGTCWGTSNDPTTNCSPASGLTTGVFSHSRTGMPTNTRIYYRGYATNTTGTGYSPSANFINGSCGTANGKTYTSASTGYSPDLQCASGTSSNTAFPGLGGSVTWTCNGDGGGLNSSSCSASRSAPDLTAGTISPTSAAVGVATTFSSTITNGGNQSTGASFSNRFQVATAAGGGGTVSTISTNTLSTLIEGASAVVTSSSYSFSPSGTYSVRVCADTNSSGTGAITESNEGNNCSGWQNITVSANVAPTVTSPTATSITSTAATLGANVTSLGQPASISARGTCWGTSPNPTSNCTSASGLTTGVFTHFISGFNSNTIYFRGYATNTTAGTGYSSDGTIRHGVCGTRNTNYPAGTSAWPGGSTYCTQVSNDTSPSFPTVGNPANWNCIGSGSPAGVSAGVTVSCQATVSPNTYTLSVTKTNGAGGRVTSQAPGINCGADCSEDYTAGTSVILTATPSSSFWKFNGWSGGGCSGTVPTCTVSLTSPTTVNASFSLRYFLYREF